MVLMSRICVSPQDGILLNFANLIGEKFYLDVLICTYLVKLSIIQMLIGPLYLFFCEL